MSPSFGLTHVALRVRDLHRSLDFYTRKVGLAVVGRSDRNLELAPHPTRPSILTLTPDASAPEPPRSAAGLFHAALLFPGRSSLGGWLRRAAENDVEFDGFSDHGVSEALYFTDPDGNGLEFYADRPREVWPFADGQVAMVTEPLDINSLLESATPDQTEPLRGAGWGHLHLRVRDLAQSEDFYREQLGLAVTQRSYPGARFLAADGYHHHLGLNVWGHPHEPQPAGALGLLSATFARRNAAGVRELHDPNGIAIRVTAL